MSSKLSQKRYDTIAYFTFSSISWHWKLLIQNRSRELDPEKLYWATLTVFSCKALTGLKIVNRSINWCCTGYICICSFSPTPCFHLCYPFPLWWIGLTPEGSQFPKLSTHVVGFFLTLLLEMQSFSVVIVILGLPSLTHQRMEPAITPFFALQ